MTCRSAIRAAVLLATPTEANTLCDQIAVFDHSLTRPRAKTQKAVRTSNPRPAWFANVCSQDNIHVGIAHEQYYRSADGKLMRSPRKTGCRRGHLEQAADRERMR